MVSGLLHRFRRPRGGDCGGELRRLMPWWLLVLILLPPGFVLGIIGLFWIASRSTPTRVLRGLFNGKPKSLRIHEKHWIAKALKGWGQGVGNHIHLDWRMVPLTEPHPKGEQVAEAYMVGHEIVHCYFAWLKGLPVWLVGWLIEFVRRGHKRHREEKQARAQAHAIVVGKHPRITFPELRQFWNRGDPR